MDKDKQIQELEAALKCCEKEKKDLANIIIQIYSLIIKFIEE